jgi:hypothetical protein
MRVSPKLRATLLIAALAATLGAVYWASRLPVDEAPAEGRPSSERRPDPERAMVAARGPGARDDDAAPSAATGARPSDSTPTGAVRRRDTSADASRGLDLSRLQRRRSAEPSDDLFGETDFSPPKPLPKRPIARPAEEIAAAPPPPAPPAPPPVPFTYLGRLAEGQQTTVFLAAGDRNLVVKAGDVIDNTYRVDEVGDRVLMLTYLPQNVKQPLPIGAP